MPVGADRRHELRALGRVLLRRKPASMARRRRYERDPAAWLRYYLAATFPLPFGDVHKRMIAAAVRAVRDGQGMVTACPRGCGKSSILWGLCLWAVLSGEARFPVCAAWAHGAARRMLRRWLVALADNSRLAADYPVEVAPFRETTHPVRLRLLRWKDSGAPAGADCRISDGLIQLPDGRGALGAASVHASTRGLTATMPSGETLRPDVLFVDDPQSKAVAESAAEVRKATERIESDLFNLAGPDRRLAVMMAGTVIQAGDVTEHFLAHPDFEPVRVGQVTSWPTGFDDKSSPVRRLWEAWNVERVEGMAEGDGGKRARAFYRAHKAELTAGLSVSWAHRYDRKRGDPDAKFAALWDFYRLGERAFMAERQNTPQKEGVNVYTLTPQVIESRATERPAGAVPGWVRLRVAATDINPSYGLTWAAVGFGADQTAAVLAYGMHPMAVAPGATEAETARAIYEGLTAHGHTLAALPCRPEVWFVDAGGAAFDTVLRFAVESVRLCGLQATPATGRGARNYKPFGKSVLGQPGEQCHRAVDVRGRKWIAWNADYWKEVAQKSWTGSIGAPGSCSLPAGRHRDFAEQVAREQLADKALMAGEMRWEWRTQPGPHDFGDCMAMAFCAASLGGIGTAGGDVKPATTRPARVVVSRPSQNWRARRW